MTNFLYYAVAIAGACELASLMFKLVEFIDR